MDAFDRFEAAPPLPKRPAIVLSAEKPWPSPATAAQSGGITFAEWLAAQGALAISLHASHIVETHSGHGLYFYQPHLVVDVIRKVVDVIRLGAGKVLAVSG